MSDDPVETVDGYTDELIDEAARLMTGAENLVVLTGAGVSTDSGIPDFRSPETGIWSKISPEESRKMFTNPPIFWKIVRELAPSILKAKPNKTHDIIHKLEELKIIKTLITQNIDGLHQAAGSRLVYELHGDAREFRCIMCHGTFDAKKIIKKHKKKDDKYPPTCPQCGAAMTLNVVLFQQQLSKGIWLESAAQAQNADVFMVIGSSLMVAPANELPIYAKKYGGKVIIINNSPTDLDQGADLVLRGGSTEILKKLYKSIKKILKERDD